MIWSVMSYVRRLIQAYFNNQSVITQMRDELSFPGIVE